MRNFIGRLFLPKNKLFYELFEEVAATLVKMGQVFHQMINEGDTNQRSTYLTQLEDLEHKNDDHTHKLFTELSRNFITPIDREDIHYLASALDDIADYIFASAKKIQLYKVNPQEPGISKMVELINDATQEVQKAVNGLRDMKHLREMTEAMVRVNSIENQSDDIYYHNLESLFAEESNAKELIKKREIYQILETVIDKCEDASNIIESIIIKYA